MAFEQNNTQESLRQPEGVVGRQSPNDFSGRARNVIGSFLSGNGLNAGDFGGMQGQAGGNLNRFAGWIRSNGLDRRAGRGRNAGRGMRQGPDRNADTGMETRRGGDFMPIEEAVARVGALREKFPGIQSTKFPFDNHEQMQRWLTRFSINPSDYRSWVEKMEKTADRMRTELPQRPGWQNPEAWTQGMTFDGFHFWAFNGQETCMSTAGQMLFAPGAQPDQIKAQLKGQKPQFQMRSKDGKAVKWELTSYGQEFTTDGGQRKVYAANNDGDTVEIKSAGRIQSVTHFGDTIVSRVNGQGAGVAQSQIIEDTRVHNGLPQGTFVRLPNGEWLGNSAREIQRRGTDGYIRAMAALPVRELAAYISSIINGQTEDVYNVRNRSQAVAFYRDDLDFMQSLRQGRGDCRKMAKLAELVLRQKGVKCVTLRLGKDHAGLAWIEPSGNPQAPYVCRTIESSGFHDKNRPAATPGQALLNAWEEETRSPGMAEIINDKMKSGKASYDKIAAGIVNAQVVA